MGHKTVPASFATLNSSAWNMLQWHGMISLSDFGDSTKCEASPSLTWTSTVGRVQQELKFGAADLEIFAHEM